MILLRIKTMETYCASCKKNTANKNSKMNEIANKLLLTGVNFMPKIKFKTAAIYFYCMWIAYLTV